jgi:4-diphosphocytidyl-2-C-methyl-D-erythritol kinase
MRWSSPPRRCPRAIFEHPLLKRDTEAVIVAGFLQTRRHLLTGCSVGRTGIGRRRGPRLGSAQAGFGRNDLQPGRSRMPEVALAAAGLQARFGNSRMTGSGSAVFARVGQFCRRSARGDIPGG